MRTRCHQRGYGFRLEIELQISNDPVVNNRIRRIISMALLLGSLGMFVAFHFLPFTIEPDSPQHGWEAWHSLYMTLKNSRWIGPFEGITISAFLMFSLIIVASPFLSIVWQKSRFAWRFVSIFSGLVALSFTIPFAIEGVWGKLASGAWFLITAPYLNFLGLLLARRWREEHRNSPIPPPNSL